MIRKKELFFLSALLSLTFLISTNYLLSTLTRTESEVKTIHEKIYLQLKNLPNSYRARKPLKNELYEAFINNIYSESYEKNYSRIWNIANSWVSEGQVIDAQSPFVGSLLTALKNAAIIKADLDTRGTQLKFLLTLEGYQNVIFKPKWYNISTIIEGVVYAGKDRYNSEIIAFYLSIILNMPLTPFITERSISLTRDIMPVATKRLIDTSFLLNNRTCVYGKCLYCKKEDPICEDNNHYVTGALIFNINSLFKSYRSPWQRTYKKNKKAVWEEDDNYCRIVKRKISRRRLLDLVDVSIFDFLIQNGDRHHYETLFDRVVFLDNGKGLGNPNISHLDILAPLYQCCILRTETLHKLQNLADGNLLQRLKKMPFLERLITTDHLKAIEQRLLIIFATIDYCKNMNKVT